MTRGEIWARTLLTAINHRRNIKLLTEDTSDHALILSPINRGSVEAAVYSPEPCALYSVEMVVSTFGSTNKVAALNCF